MFTRRAGTGFILLALLFFASTALADSRARIVRLSLVEGDVQLDQRTGQGYDRAVMNMPVVEGLRLWTRGGDSLAEVELEDGSSIRLTPDTIVEFEELGLRSSGDRVTSVELQEGTAYFDINEKNHDFRVTFGGQQLSLSKSARFRLRVDRSDVKLAVYKGELDVRTGATEVAVRKNETLTLDLSDPGRYMLAKGISDDSYDDWSEERAKYRETYTSAGYSAYSGYSPYYSYGVSDLQYYGSYFNAPGYGWMWRPRHVWAGWNPFLDGAWAWYPGFGYMWVSAYPWGWIPYRYGSWYFVPTYGWCWRPGTTWNRWAPVSVVNRAPSGWVAPRPPASPPTPGRISVVSVGRGPATIFPDGVTPPGTRVRVIRDVDKPRGRIVMSGSGNANPRTSSATPSVSVGTAPAAGVRLAPAAPLPAVEIVQPASPAARTESLPPRRTKTEDVDVPRGRSIGSQSVPAAPRGEAPKTTPPPAPRSQPAPSTGGRNWSPPAQTTSPPAAAPGGSQGGGRSAAPPASAARGAAKAQ
jgi:hypothetical protein